MSFTLRVRDWEETGETDDFNVPVKSWVYRDWEVRSIAPGSMEEPRQGGRDLSVVMWTIYADAGSQPNDHSEVQLPGSPEWYAVEGMPADWTMGPPQVGPVAAQHTAPGVVVELRRANG